jgi:transcriptional/translational regulatory protein YebC/TACO1
MACRGKHKHTPWDASGSKKEITANKRASITTKLVREITVAAKSGMPDPAHNPRLEVAVEAARKQSVSNDVIQRAIKRGAGGGSDGAVMELVTIEGYAPYNVPAVVPSRLHKYSEAHGCHARCGCCLSRRPGSQRVAACWWHGYRS